MKLMTKNGAYMHAYNVNDEKALRGKGWKFVPEKPVVDATAVKPKKKSKKK